MDKQKKDWQARYDAGKTGWDRGGDNPQLHNWLKNKALTPCRVLVPGCGNGYEVISLAKARFEVVAIDIAPTPIQNLKKQLRKLKLQAEVLQEDILQWQCEHLFDTIYEQTSLCALEPKTWQQYEQQLHQWLKPNGTLLTLFMQTQKEGGPPYHCDLTEMRHLFAPTRWKWSPEGHRIPHPAGFFEIPVTLKKN